MKKIRIVFLTALMIGGIIYVWGAFKREPSTTNRFAGATGGTSGYNQNVPPTVAPQSDENPTEAHPAYMRLTSTLETAQDINNMGKCIHVRVITPGVWWVMRADKDVNKTSKPIWSTPSKSDPKDGKKIAMPQGSEDLQCAYLNPVSGPPVTKEVWLKWWRSEPVMIEYVKK